LEELKTAGAFGASGSLSASVTSTKLSYVEPG